MIEWIKGLLAVPFVLHAQPTALYDHGMVTNATQLAANVRRRYAEIMRDVEELINDHIVQQEAGAPERSKLKSLVPTVGNFFTPLPLEAAFLFQDELRRISSRHFVAPSFNDVRLTLNTAQLMSLVRANPVQLITFDGDLTLYDDGESLTSNNPVIPRIIRLLQQNICVGIVTAAGYTDARGYYRRLHGLLDAACNAPSIDLGAAPSGGHPQASGNGLTEAQRRNLVVIGGECNFLLRVEPDDAAVDRTMTLKFVPRDDWALNEMKDWRQEDIQELLSVADSALRECIENMNLPAKVVRKPWAVGIIPDQNARLSREQLEETVLVVQRKLQLGTRERLPFCAFNGGHDVFVDIGDKSWGVLCMQRFFGGIPGHRSLHVGDQFLSAGANDFKARLACTTAWIANPAETVALLDELQGLLDTRAEVVRRPR